MTTHRPDDHDRGRGDLNQQIAGLTEILGALSTQITRLEARHNRLARTVAGKDTKSESGEERPEPAAWAWFSPPAAAEDDPQSREDPRFTVENFIAFFNVTYRGPEGGRAKPIPDCWRHHPGLAAEVATLAYSWRAAHVGSAAAARDAQHWHHQWRPGFTERLGRDWVSPDCLDGHHQPTGATPRADRHTLADEHADTARNRPDPGGDPA